MWRRALADVTLEPLDRSVHAYQSGEDLDTWPLLSDAGFRAGWHTAGDRRPRLLSAESGYHTRGPQQTGLSNAEFPLVETQWGWGLGDHGEVGEWLELVCVCANVLCWLS